MSGLIQNTESKIALVHKFLYSYLYNLNFAFIIFSYQKKICSRAHRTMTVDLCRLLTKIFSLRQSSLRLLRKNILVHKATFPDFVPQQRFSLTNRVECFINENLTMSLRNVFSAFQEKINGERFFFSLAHLMYKEG